MENLSYNEEEALKAIQKTGSYSSTVHNDRTKALEGLISKGFSIKREVINKCLMQFTYVPKITSNREFLQALKDEDNRIIAKAEAGEKLTEREQLAYDCIKTVRRRVNTVFGRYN